MQAVILAGGLGTRLRPYTEQVPKPMMEVLGKPFLEYQLEYLKKRGIADVVLCTGYLHEKIREYFGDGSALGLNLAYSVEDRQRGTAYALTLAQDLLEDEFLFLYGDTYLPIDYSKLFALLHKPSTLGVLTVYTNPAGEFANNILTKGGRVVAYEKGKPEGKNGVEAGASAFSKRILAFIESGNDSLEMQVFPKLISRNALRALVTGERFYDIGTPQALEYFREHARSV